MFTPTTTAITAPKTKNSAVLVQTSVLKTSE